MDSKQKTTTKIPLVIAIWFWVLLVFMHITYPDQITTETGLSYFGLYTTPSGVSNVLTAILFFLLLLGITICFSIQALYLKKNSPFLSAVHLIIGIGAIGVMFPFDKYQTLHDLGALIVYIGCLILAIYITKYAFQHQYRKIAEMSLLGITGFLIIIFILYIAFTFVIIFIGGILQKIYLILFFVLYLGFPSSIEPDSKVDPNNK